jgi:hypothetical protein
MKRNFSTPILKIDGTAFDDKPTLATVSFMALTANLPGDDRMTGEQKVKLYKLAHLVVHAGGVKEVTAEDIALLKDRIGKAFGVLVVGAAWDLLEQDVAAYDSTRVVGVVDDLDKPETL